MNTKSQIQLAKVPQVTFMFWIVKIAVTTLGETGGDAVSMSMGIGYAGGSVLFFLLFAVAVAFQLKSTEFNQYKYWVTVIATTTAGTTLADFVDRTLGLGYAGGVTLLITMLAFSFYLWFRISGTVSANSIKTPSSETLYWLTIMFSQTLGTALGDWTADIAGLGYIGSMYIFSALLLFLTCLYFYSQASRTLLFWSAFILSRPLGAVLGDFIDKPLSAGGLELSRYSASFSLMVFVIACLMISPQCAASENTAKKLIQEN
ncbi:hypothetical protein ACVAAS_003606 [Enterobacter roggenkampii]